MAKTVKLLECELKNKVGVLATMTGALKAAKINILHISGWAESGKAYVYLATNNNSKAKIALKKAGIRAGEDEMLFVSLPHKVGSLDRIAQKLAKANIDICCIKATTGSGGSCGVLLCTNNNGKARRIL